MASFLLNYVYSGTYYIDDIYFVVNATDGVPAY